MSLIGQKIVNYRIVSKIGEGGMGSVYMATHELLHTKAAIKVLHPSLSADPSLRSRFLTEASTLSALNHPNIVRVLDFFENPQGLFIIMEYVSGIPLDELIKTKTGPIPEQKAFSIFEKILNGFQYAHTRKPAIIHRDIKPSNIIIDEFNEPKIIDFGIVKIIDTDVSSGHTIAGTKIGTPSFMSPEQILGKDVDARSDIFSLGITLFTMLTGRSPFDKTLSEFEIHNTIINNPLPRARDIYPGVSEKAQQIIDKATAKKKENRYKNCNEFVEALHSDLEPKTQPDEIVSYPPELFQEKKSNAAVGIVVGAVIAIGLILFLVFKEKKDTTNYADSTTTIDSVPDTVVTVSDNNTTTSTYAAQNSSENSIPPERDPDQYELNNITTVLNDYFKEDNKAADEMNIEKILSFYAFPEVSRYYTIMNPGYNEVYNRIDSYVNGKLNYHHLEIDWGASTAVKIGDSYHVYIKGEYEWTTKAAPTDLKKRTVYDTYILNSDYKITSVFSSI